MKRMFITRTESARATNNIQQPLAPPTATPASSASNDPDSDDETVQHNTVAQSQSNDRFRDMAARHSLSAQEDETDRQPVTCPNVIGRTVKLVELFNFHDSHWVDQYKHAVRCSFEEELELYELLDLDAEDEEEADVDVDDTTGEILIG